MRHWQRPRITCACTACADCKREPDSLIRSIGQPTFKVCSSCATYHMAGTRYDIHHVSLVRCGSVPREATFRLGGRLKIRA